MKANQFYSKNKPRIEFEKVLKQAYLFSLTHSTKTHDSLNLKPNEIGYIELS